MMARLSQAAFAAQLQFKVFGKKLTTEAAGK